MLKLIFILVLIHGIFKNSEAICNQCNVNNGVACISKTEFQICAEGVPISSNTFSCLNSNEICTKHGAVCMDSTLTAGILPACGDTANCGECKDVNDGSYVCTSRTTYTMCLDDKLTEIRMSCAENQLCDSTIAAEGLYPCVPACREPEIKFCDLKDAVDVPISTTEATTATTEPIEVTTELSTQENIPTTTEEITTLIEEIATTTAEIPTSTEEITTATAEITETTEEITTTTIYSPTPAITSTTQLPTITTENPADSVCSQQTTVGRYPYPNDTTCRKYIYCFRKGGIMQSTFLTCPEDRYFNSSTGLCGDLKPQDCTTETTTELTTQETSTISTTAEEITTTTISAPAITSTTQPPTTATENPADIVCSQQAIVGRYPYLNDITCRKYIYCFRKGGIMQSTFLTCPEDRYLNSSTGLCGEHKPQGCN